MRQKLKLILFAALSAALTVAGLSIAAGGGRAQEEGEPTARLQQAYRDKRRAETFLRIAGEQSS